MIKILLLLSAYAQGNYRARPEDYSDFGVLDKSITEGAEILIFISTIAILILVGISMISNTIKTRISQNKEIKGKVKFSVISNRMASTNIYRTISNEKHYGSNDYFKEKDKLVCIPGGSECIILEYTKENSNYVKVKFDEYPTPLYICRKHLLEVSQRIIHYFVTTADQYAATNSELYSKMYLHKSNDKNYFIEDNGYELIPKGAKFTSVLDTVPHYTPYMKVIFEGYPIPLYINRTQIKEIPPTA